jgi:hypothetical protein
MAMNVIRPLLDAAMAMGLAMKEVTRYVRELRAEREMMNRGVGTENEVSMEVTEVRSGGSGGTSGGQSSQTLADQDVEMGGAEVGVGAGESAGGEEGGEEGGVGGEVVVGDNTTLFIFIYFF